MQPEPNPRSAPSALHVSLIGREQSGDENLALRYLAAALRRSGHRPSIVPLSGPDQLPAAARAVLASAPPLIGLSIPDADIAVDALAFVRYVRQRGYRGHITCGGALATLVRHELLARHPGIDSVVRHDGEWPLVELASRLAAGEPWQDVPGVSTRAGDGLPARVMDPSPLELRPDRPERLPELVGVPVARLLASRGCPGRCAYCGPAALQREALGEGLRAGLDYQTLSRAGIGATRRRPAADVAEEVADLFHRRKARFFHALDDNLLSGDPRAAAIWLGELGRELERLRVGRCAWSFQVEPGVLVPEIIDRLVHLGVIRLAVGMEALTAGQLGALGRRGDPGRHRLALERLRDLGVVTVFNSLIVHPEATPDSIAVELDALSSLEGIHFDALSMAVYPGTLAHEALCRQGRVTGGMLGLRFEPLDPVVARFRAALIRLRLQAAGRYGPNVFAHDVCVNLALARRLGLPRYNAALAEQARAALNAMNELRIRAWWAALALAKTELLPADREQATSALVLALGRDLRRSFERFASIEARLEGEVDRPVRAKNLLVASTLAAGFTFCLVPAAGCGGQTTPSGFGSLHDASVLDAAEDGARADGGPSHDASMDRAPDAPDTGSTCTAAEHDSEHLAALNAVSRDGCASCTGSDAPFGIAIDAQGRVVDIRAQDGSTVPSDVRQCYLEALAGQTFPCLSGEDVWQECVICLF